MNSPAQVEHALLTVFLQLIVIVASARLAGALFRRIGQPQVCGEIAAGLILGPSLLGGMFPNVFATLFDPAVGPVINIMSQLGLVLMMFLIGLEFDFGHLDDNRWTAISVSLAGIILPFGLGFALGLYIHPAIAASGSALNFALFMATAMSITAIPVLGRIMIELNIQRTRIGSLTISAAGIGDAVGWILLALVTAIVQSQFDPMKLSLMVAETIAFGLAMIFAVRPLLVRAIRKFFQPQGELSLDMLAALLLIIFLAAVATNLIGIFSVFGAFLLGAVLYDQHEFVAAIHRRLNDFITVFFLPIFFTYTGLRTDVGSMAGTTTWVFCGLILLTAMVGKFGGCTFAARWSGLPWRESAIIGVMMNTRGLMELIVINMGYDLGIIPKNVFFMLVFMAVVTTYMTAPLVRLMIRNSEIEKEYRTSALAQGL
jgi:Kef-type K+ transport system membrane component KefB